MLEKYCMLFPHEKVRFSLIWSANCSHAKYELFSCKTLVNYCVSERNALHQSNNRLKQFKINYEAI